MKWLLIIAINLNPGMCIRMPLFFCYAIVMCWAWAAQPSYRKLVQRLVRIVSRKRKSRRSCFWCVNLRVCACGGHSEFYSELAGNHHPWASRCPPLASTGIFDCRVPFFKHLCICAFASEMRTGGTSPKHKICMDTCWGDPPAWGHHN